jgi:hypothetical protein
MGHLTGKHAQTGSSYFDPLWRSGTGKHAKWKTCIVILIERGQHASVPSPQTHQNSSQPHMNAGKTTTGGQKNHNWKSDMKQKRRDEPQLKKKSKMRKTFRHNYIRSCEN